MHQHLASAEKRTFVCSGCDRLLCAPNRRSAIRSSAFAAATIGHDEDDRLGYLLGDMLVRVDSAVDAHEDDLRKLHIKLENCRAFHQKHRFDLLWDPRVHQ